MGVGWDEPVQAPNLTWRLDAYLSQGAFSNLQEPVLLGVVDEAWPSPPNYPISQQPPAALDLLEYPERVPSELDEKCCTPGETSHSCWRGARQKHGR